MHIGFHTRPI